MEMNKLLYFLLALAVLPLFIAAPSAPVFFFPDSDVNGQDVNVHIAWAEHFIGDGSGLTGLPAGGGGGLDTTLDSNAAAEASWLAKSHTFAVDQNFSKGVQAQTFFGSAKGLTDVDVNNTDMKLKNLNIDNNLGVKGDANFYDTVGISSNLNLDGNMNYRNIRMMTQSGFIGSGTVATSTYLGGNAGLSSDGQYVAGLGYYACNANDANYVVCIGNYAGLQNKGPYGVFIGDNAGRYGSAAAANNIAIGSFSLASGSLTGDSDTCIGVNSCASMSTGFYNFGLGRNALYYATSGNYNTVIGVYGNFYTTTGGVNTTIGSQSQYLATTASNNASIGFRSLYNNKDGQRNVAIGNYAGFGTTGKSQSDNIYIGYYAGGANEGHKNIIIGSDLHPENFAGDINKVLNIGGLLYGNMDENSIGIGAAPTKAKLYVDGNAWINADLNAADDVAVANNFYAGGIGYFATGLTKTIRYVCDVIVGIPSYGYIDVNGGIITKDVGC